MKGVLLLLTARRTPLKSNPQQKAANLK